MAKKFLSILLVLVLVLGLLPATGAAALSTSPTFSDMPDNCATEALESAVANGLLVGDDGKIMPDSPLTRAQMATIIARAFGATEEGDISEYTDVKSTDWFGGSMAKALKMGVMHGYDGRMNPKDNITREQAFAVLARAFKLAPATAINKTFEDLGDVSDWAKGEVYALVNAGYIHGSNGRINPQANISRAEFAQMIHNLIKQYIKAEGEYTEVADGNIMVNVPDATLKNVTINGDLIVGDGVGDGDLILDNVTLKGRLVARGGGANSIIIRGGSVEGKVIIAKVDGDIRVSVEGGADVKVIIIDDGKDDVIIEGTVGTVEVTAAGVPVVIQNATVEKIEVVASGATNITVANGAAVTNVVVNSGAVGTTLNIEGNVNTVETSAANTAVSGTGTVKNVTAKEGADNTTVTTPGTKINNEGASGVAVSAITVTGKGNVTKITTLKGTLQMLADVKPTTATNKTVKWSVTNEDGSVTDKAIINANGLLTAVQDGKVKVKATSVSTPAVSDDIVIEISGQLLPSTIVFNDAAPIAKIIGDKPFINKVTGGDGEGVITYTSGTPATATVNKTTGEVTILAVGSTVITATKAATATHSETTNTYTINISKKDAIPLTSMSPIVGEAKVGVELTAGSLAPKEATVTYAWLRIKSGMAEFEYIPGATTNKYTPVSDDVGYYIRVAATGIGNYSGIAVSKNTGAVSSSEVSGFAGGSGTVEDPYQVATAKQLDNIRNHLDKHFVQTADINLGVAPWNTGEGWVPIADYKIQVRYDKFEGSYNGDIYKITGLTINSPEKPYISLFGYNSYKGKLNNVKILNANINGKSSCGTLVGENEGTINNCYATGYIIGTYARTGGLVGSNSGTIDSSYATTTVDGASYKGGLVGDNEGTILNCYATGSILSWGKAGGLVGENTGTIDNCYAAGLCEGSESEFGKGGLVGNQVSGKITRSYYDEDTTLRFDTKKGQGKTSGEMTTKSTFIDWDFGSTWSIKTSPGSYPYLKWQTENIAYPQAEFASGSGTESDPYKVSTARELNSVRKHLDKYFIQTADINLDVYPWYHDRGWDQIGDYKEKFTGNYNGNGKRISGLTMHRPGEENCGLFGYTSETAKISKLGLANVKIEGKGYTGGLVGMNYGTINSCYSIGVVESEGYVIGGLVGDNSGTIISCSSAASVKGKPNVGGLVGINNGVIEKSYSVDLVTGVDRVGGLIGSNFGTITSSYATGDVNGKRNYTGGLIGSNFGTITSSYAKGSVKGAEYTGGLVGYNNTEGIISKSYATGFVDGSDKTGGFAGANFGNIDSSYATGSVDGGHDTGGLVGFNGRIVTNTYARGSVKGINNVGGLVGSNYGLFLGKDKVYINCSYATGFVEAINTVGKRYEAGLVGNNDGQVNYCYYDKNTTLKNDSGKGNPKTTAKMMNKSTFEVWDFGGTWDIGISPASYPYFKWQGTKNIPTP